MADLVTELGEVNDVVAAQVEVGMSRDEVVESLYRSWLDRITQLKSKLSNAVVTQLSCAIKNTPFTQDQRTNLARAVLNIGSTNKKVVARSNQKCHNLENFIPEGTWVKMKDFKMSRNYRLSLIAQVCGRLRIVNPDQPTLYRGVAISEFCNDNYEASQDQVLQWMDTLKTMIKQQPDNRDIDYIVSFPVSAADLPITHQACLGLPLPVDVEIPELGTILGGTKMRGRKLKTSDPPWLKTSDPPWLASILAQIPDASTHDGIRMSLLANAGGSAGQLHQSQQNVSKEPLQSPQAPPEEKASLPQILRFTRPQQFSNASSQPVSSLLKLEDTMHDVVAASRKDRNMRKSKGGKKKKSDTDEDDDDEGSDENFEEPEEEDDEEEDDEDEDDEDSGDMVSKKPATKLKRPAATNKRPAAAPSMFKRPAGKQPLLKNVFRELRRIGPSISRKRFTSRAYHAAQKIQQRNGKSADNAKAAARSASKKASKLYDELAKGCGL